MITNEQAIEMISTRTNAIDDVAEGLERLLQRSATDPKFREQLLTDSRAALESFHGRPVPEGLNITFVENHGAATIVLPDAIDPAAELSDDELMAVAGGGTPVLTATWVPSLNVAASVLSVIASVTYWLND